MTIRTLAGAGVSALLVASVATLSLSHGAAPAVATARVDPKDATAAADCAADAQRMLAKKQWDKAVKLAEEAVGLNGQDAGYRALLGAAYLRAMHDRYGNATAMLAAYNAGPGRYDEYLSRGRPLPVETRAYLAKLASITGGSDDTRLAAAPLPDPFAWRRAALFAVRPGAVSPAPRSADRTVSQVPPEGPADDRAGLVMADAASPSNGLFVPLSGRPPP